MRKNFYTEDSWSSVFYLQNKTADFSAVLIYSSDLLESSATISRFITASKL